MKKIIFGSIGFLLLTLLSLFQTTPTTHAGCRDIFIWQNGREMRTDPTVEVNIPFYIAIDDCDIDNNPVAYTGELTFGEGKSSVEFGVNTNPSFDAQYAFRDVLEIEGIWTLSLRENNNQFLRLPNFLLSTKVPQPLPPPPDVPGPGDPPPGETDDRDEQEEEGESGGGDSGSGDIEEELLCESGGVNTAIGCIPFGSSGELIGFFVSWALGIAGGIALLIIIIAAFQITTSAGDPKKLQAGRELLFAAISGIILIIFSVFVLRIIGVNILGIF